MANRTLAERRDRRMDTVFDTFPHQSRDKIAQINGRELLRKSPFTGRASFVSGPVVAYPRALHCYFCGFSALWCCSSRSLAGKRINTIEPIEHSICTLPSADPASSCNGSQDDSAAKQNAKTADSAEPTQNCVHGGSCAHSIRTWTRALRVCSPSEQGSASFQLKKTSKQLAEDFGGKMVFQNSETAW